MLHLTAVTNYYTTVTLGWHDCRLLSNSSMQHFIRVIDFCSEKKQTNVLFRNIALQS